MEAQSPNRGTTREFEKIPELQGTKTLKLFSLFFQFYLRCSWQKVFKVYNVLIWYTYIVKGFPIHHVTYQYLFTFVCVTEVLFDSLNKFNTFQLYSIVLATKDYLLIGDNWKPETLVWHFQSTERKKKKKTCSLLPLPIGWKAKKVYRA